MIEFLCRHHNFHCIRDQFAQSTAQVSFGTLRLREAFELVEIQSLKTTLTFSLFGLHRLVLGRGFEFLMFYRLEIIRGIVVEFSASRKIVWGGKIKREIAAPSV